MVTVGSGSGSLDRTSLAGSVDTNSAVSCSSSEEEPSPSLSEDDSPPTIKKMNVDGGLVCQKYMYILKILTYLLHSHLEPDPGPVLHKPLP